MKVKGEKIYFNELECIESYKKKHGMK